MARPVAAYQFPVIDHQESRFLVAFPARHSRGLLTLLDQFPISRAITPAERRNRCSQGPPAGCGTRRFRGTTDAHAGEKKTWIRSHGFSDVEWIYSWRTWERIKEDGDQRIGAAGCSLTPPPEGGPLPSFEIPHPFLVFPPRLTRDAAHATPAIHLQLGSGQTRSRVSMGEPVHTT